MYVFLGLFTLCSLPLYEYMSCGRNPEANSLSKQVTYAIKRTIMWQTSFIPCHTWFFLYCKEIVCCMQHTALYQWPEFVNQMKKSKYWVSLYLDHIVFIGFRNNKHFQDYDLQSQALHHVKFICETSCLRRHGPQNLPALVTMGPPNCFSTKN